MKIHPGTTKRIRKPEILWSLRKFGVKMRDVQQFCFFYPGDLVTHTDEKPEYFISYLKRLPEINPAGELGDMSAACVENEGQVGLYTGAF